MERETPRSAAESITAGDAGASRLAPGTVPKASVVLVQPAAPTSGAEEKEAKREHEAKLLLAVLPPRALPVIGGKGSSVPFDAAAYEADAIKFLVDKGGKSSAKVSGLRLFLEAFAVWRESVHAGAPVWPISSTDARSARETFCGVTAKDRVAPSMLFASECQLPVEYIESVFEVRRLRKEMPEPKARDAAGPLLLYRLSCNARNPPPGTPPALVEKWHELYLDAALATRGGGLHDSKVSSAGSMHPPGVPGAIVWESVTAEDKLNRANVKQWTPAVDFVTGEAIEWAPAFVEDRAGVAFIVTDWVDGLSSAGKKSTSVTAAVDIKRAEGLPTFCPARRALKGLADAVPSAVGIPPAVLKARKWSGLHALRHVAGEVTYELGWLETEACVIADWTPAAPEARSARAAPPTAGRGARKRKAPTTRVQYYAPNATKVEQIRIRTRYFKAIAAGLRRFGYDNLTVDTTWSDIFPKPPPPEIAHFYYEERDPDGNALYGDVDVEPEAA